MSVDDQDPPAAAATVAFKKLRDNLEYARDMVRGGRYLQGLDVRAFEVADLYRAAWVQAVSALDHWVHRELYSRALGYALDASVPRPAKFLKVHVPMSLFEDVHHGSTAMQEAFGAELEKQFGYQSFQTPEKIKQALAVVTDARLWPKVAQRVSSGNQFAETISPEQVQTRLKEIVKRRNRIAHEADRDPAHRGGRNAISATEAAETIDWIQGLAAAMLSVLGPPPPGADVDEADSRGSAPQRKWSRHDVNEAVDEIGDVRVADAVRTLLGHADAHGALFKGGQSPDPSAGLYYLLHGKRRSLWSLYLTVGRPSIALNFASVWPVGQQPARGMFAEIRRDPSLDAALLNDDDTVLRKYPGISLATLGEAPEALDAVIRALDLVTSSKVN
jgi:hypothetical protein